ncbi:MAG: hypothetical protein ABI217_02410 [Chthoniobacterales bacterium]
MIKTSIFSALAACVLALTVQAQSPVVVQAADSAPANPAAAAAATKAPASDSKNMLQSLQAMQILNEATIKKQEATLATLDELQKAAEELKIFSKRG